jgi:hypothetical protein
VTWDRRLYFPSEGRHRVLIIRNDSKVISRTRDVSDRVVTKGIDSDRVPTKETYNDGVLTEGSCERTGAVYRKRNQLPRYSVDATDVQVRNCRFQRKLFLFEIITVERQNIK